MPCIQRSQHVPLKGAKCNTESKCCDTQDSFSCKSVCPECEYVTIFDTGIQIVPETGPDTVTLTESFTILTDDQAFIRSAPSDGDIDDTIILTNLSNGDQYVLGDLNDHLVKIPGLMGQPDEEFGSLVLWQVPCGNYRIEKVVEDGDRLAYHQFILKRKFHSK